MRDEPQDLVSDLVTGILVRLRKYPAKVHDRRYVHKTVDRIWFDMFGEQHDRETGKTIKRGTQRKLAYKNIQAEHELGYSERRHLAIQTQGNCHEDPG